MSNWVLLLLLTLQFLISYLLHGKKLSPSCILTLTVLVPTLVLILMYDYIQYELAYDSIVIIVLLFVFFQVGEILGWTINCESIKRKTKRCSFVIVDRRFAKFAVAFMLFYLLLNFSYVMRIGAEYGVNNFIGAFAANRLNTVAIQKTGVPVVDVQPSSLNVISMYIANSIEVICLHAILIQKLIMRTKMDKLLIVTVFLYFVSLLIEGGRATMVPFIIHMLYLIIILSGVKMIELVRQNKMRIVLLIAFLVLFFIASGTFRGQKDYEKGDDVEVLDLRNTFATYVASPIMGFDIYVKQGMGDYNYFGQHLFKGIYDIMRRFGLDIERDKKHQDNFVYKNIESNAHAGIWHWIKDFRLLGSLIYSLILGSIFGFIHLMEKRNVIRLDNVIGCYVVSMLYWALIMLFFGDMFRLFFSLDFYYVLFIMYVLMKFKVVRFHREKLIV